jgi:hypothetical protein
MPKDIASEESYINDQLAEFADRVIEGEEFQRLTSEESAIMSDLQTVILEVHRSVSHVSPDQKVADRMHRNLVKVWRKEIGKRDDKENLLDRIARIFSPRQTGWQSTAQRRRRLTSQVALAVIIAMVFLIPLTQSQGSLPGAATGGSGWATIIFILVIASSITAWYLWRRKK